MSQTPDANEADVDEQRRETATSTEDQPTKPRRRPWEVDPADNYEQEREVPMDDD